MVERLAGLWRTTSHKALARAFGGGPGVFVERPPLNSAPRLAARPGPVPGAGPGRRVLRSALGRVGRTSPVEALAATSAPAPGKKSVRKKTRGRGTKERLHPPATGRERR